MIIPRRRQKLSSLPSLRRYAFGLLLWCLFSGRANAWADVDGRLPRPALLIGRVLAGQRPDIHALRSDTPLALVSLVQRCWAHHAGERPRAGDVAAALDALLHQVRYVMRKELDWHSTLYPSPDVLQATEAATADAPAAEAALKAPSAKFVAAEVGSTEATVAKTRAQIEIIVQTLAGNDAAAAGRACEALATITSDNVAGAGAAQAAVDAGAPVGIVAALGAHVGNENVARHGSAALVNIAHLDSGRQAAIAAGAPAAIVAAMHAHASCEEVFESCRVALQVIAAYGTAELAVIEALLLLPPRRLDLPSIVGMDAESDAGVAAGLSALLSVMIGGLVPFLQQLDLSFNSVSVAGARALTTAIRSGHVPQLLQLNLRSTKIGEAGARTVAEALCSGHMPQLQLLNLRNDDIGDAGACALAEALGAGRVPMLQLLDLCWNSIGVAGARALADVLRAGHVPRLTQLHLLCNNFGDAGACTVIDALGSGRVPLLQQLDLSRNLVSEAGAEAFTSGCLPQLRRLDLASCRLGDGGVRFSTRFKG